MKSKTEWNVSVIGAGTMGLSIAQYFAMKGYSVSLYNRTAANLKRAMDMIKSNLLTLTALNEMNRREASAAIERIGVFTDLKDAVINADIVIESVTENADIKKDVFAEVCRYAPARAFLCSDTSALNIYEFLKTNRPDKVLITHFFNPAYVMPLVEIVRGPNTPDETVEAVKEFLTGAGKKPIVINECIPGFIANRLTVALAREAYYLVENGWISFDDLDTVMVTTFGPRYAFEGIFDLYDHIGLDIGAMVATNLIPKLCQRKEPSPILLEKAKAGELGVKTGRGLKDYTGQDINQIKKERDIKIIKTLKHMETL